MSTRTELLVVDGLQGLLHVMPVAASATAATAPEPLPSRDLVLDRLTLWEVDFRRTRSAATLKAVRADFNRYLAWCEKHRLAPLPTPVEQIEAYLVDAIGQERKRATIDRYVYTIGLIHDAAGLPNPLKHPRWLDPVWKYLVMQLGDKELNGRRQAGQLRNDELQLIFASLRTTRRDLRDAAMLSLASDTLLREAELVAVRWEHLHQEKERWILNVPRSKTDRHGQDKDERFVSDITMTRIRAWMAAEGFVEGLLFRPTGGRPRAGVLAAEAAGQPVPVIALRPREVARIFRRRAASAGIEAWKTISGHSVRVGTAVDLAVHGATTLQIQLAGNWKDAKSVEGYTRKSRAGIEAMDDLKKKLNGSAPGS